MKTLLKLFFIATVAIIAAVAYNYSDTPLASIENAEALAQTKIDVCHGTGNLLCAGRLVQIRLDVR